MTFRKKRQLLPSDFKKLRTDHPGLFSCPDSNRCVFSDQRERKRTRIADLLTLVDKHEKLIHCAVVRRVQRCCWCRVVLETYLPIITKVSFFIFAFPPSEMWPDTTGSSLVEKSTIENGSDQMSGCVYARSSRSSRVYWSMIPAGMGSPLIKRSNDGCLSSITPTWVIQCRV